MAFINKSKQYYKTKKEALSNRRKGDRIYYDIDLGAYYVIRPKRNDFWRD